MYLINKNTLSAKKITEIYTDYGFYEGMLLQEYSNKLLKPDDYKNNDDLKYNETNTKKWKKANIIFLLSETFFDLESIEEIKFDKPLTPFINSLKDNKNSITLNTLVETYGGMSVLSEFEILARTEEATGLCLELKYEALPAGVWGIHVVHDDRGRIFVNSLLPLVWRRFAIFHEVYHLLNHRKGARFWTHTCESMESFENRADSFAWAAIWPEWVEGDYSDWA